ncbi:hypothetical protein BABINDRAFT_162316 [Babjeviella inositovora NRRL Y-12698]|uniref:Uncharacterized protein n=1 Tax=Babjeviella inositovora NRRL Y-12698 TaxID=984486 RepID=A0A1E3QNK6_9ASCO|nr:uncharacterized protein BABINDRAFT_162316 [Babjeviella inositovora NRRL Y-12698]ODQ79289.1 hypothetical protein BABINDRAFT_162316 [Babjeviella inositovora NRRL Y-12698]
MHARADWVHMHVRPNLDPNWASVRFSEWPRSTSVLTSPENYYLNSAYILGSVNGFHRVLVKHVSDTAALTDNEQIKQQLAPKRTGIYNRSCMGVHLSWLLSLA